MRIKRFILALIFILVVFVFSGCVNVTYTVKLKDEGKADVNLSILYNNKEFSYDYEKIEEIKNKYIDAGFDVKNLSDKGLTGFQLVKKNINLDEKIKISADNDIKIDILNDLLASTEYEKGFFGNKFDIDADIDLSSYLNLNTLINSTNIEVPENYKKLLSEMNLKLIIELEKGAVTETNSTLISENKKTAEWVLIPGADNEIELEASTSDKMAIVGTVIIFGIVFIIALAFFILLLTMYLKKRKNC